MLSFQKAGTDLKKSEDKSEYLKKRNAELGGKCSKLEHGKRLEESVNEGLRAENLRLHDELQRERSQIQRDIEARKREEDNKMQSRNKDHKRVMDKDEQHHKQELACINETISEKCEEIKCLNEVLNLKEAHIAKTKLDQTKEMEDMAEAMVDAHCKKTAKLALNQYDEMQKKDVEIKDLQESLSSLELNLDSGKTDNLNKLEKQQRENKEYYCDLIEAEKRSSLKAKREFEDTMKNNAVMFRKFMEDLEMEIKRKKKDKSERHALDVSDLMNKHELKKSDLESELADAKHKIRMLYEDNAQQKKDAGNEMKICMALLETELTKKFSAIKVAELQEAEENYSYCLDVMERENEQRVKKVEDDTAEAKTKFERLEKKCSKFGELIFVHIIQI